MTALRAFFAEPLTDPPESARVGYLVPVQRDKGRLKVPLLLCLLVLLSGARGLGVGHLSDDWLILSHASRGGAASDWVEPWLGMGEESILYHRPLFTALYAAEYALFGTDPFWPHVHHLLWHLAAVLLLYSLLKQLEVPRSSSALAAALFAIHPQLAASVGWLAARCGIAAATLSLLTACLWVTAARRERAGTSPTGPRLAAWCSAMLAPLFQESGYLALITPLVIDVTLLRPTRISLIRRHLPFALLGVMLLALRMKALGTLGGGYPNPLGLLAGGEASMDALQSAWGTLLRMLGAGPSEFFSGNRLLPVTGGLLLAVIAMASWLQVRNHRERSSFQNSRMSGYRLASCLLLLFGLQFLLLLLTSNPTLGPATGHRWYLALSYICALTGLLSAPLLRRVEDMGPVALLVALYGIGFLTVQEHLIEGDASVKKVLTELHSISAAKDLPKGPMIVSCLPEARFGIPTFHWGLREAVNPPFTKKPFPRPIYPVHRFMYLGDGPGHALHPPLEALLYATGKDPVMVTMKDPHTPHSDDLSRFDFTLPTGNPKQPYVAVPRSDVARYVASLFSPTTVRVMEPPLDSQRGLPLDLSVRIALDGAREAELFAFLETFDTRIAMRVEGDQAVIEIGKKLSDYLRFSTSETEVYLLVVAYEDAARKRRRLSPLITVRVAR